MRREYIFFLASIVAVLIVGLLVFISMRSTNQPINEELGRSRIWHVTLYYPDLKTGRLTRTTASIAATEKNAVIEVVDKLKSPLDPSVTPAIPNKARLLEIKRKGKTLVLNFTKEFTEPSFWQGSEVAYLRLQAIVYTLISFPDVRRVRILVDNQIPPALGGHEDLTEPIEPDPSLYEE